MLLQPDMKGRGVKLFAGSKVMKDGVVSSAHWVCASAWMRFEEAQRENKLPTSGSDAMKAFYTFVNALLCQHRVIFF